MKKNILQEQFKKDRQARDEAGVIQALSGNELIHYYGRENKTVSKGYVSREGLAR